MAERIVELETCTVVFPDGFDANQWSYDVWLSQRKREISRTETSAPVARKVTPQEVVRKETPQELEKLPQS